MLKSGPDKTLYQIIRDLVTQSSTHKGIHLPYVLREIDCQYKVLKIFDRLFSYTKGESESNDTCVDFAELSNVNNSDRSPNATQ